MRRAMGEEKHLSDTADRGATDAQSDIFSDECSEYTELDEYDEYDECDEHEHKEYDECNEYEDEEAVPVGSSNVQYENLRYSPGSFDGKLSAVQEDSELLEEVAESSGAQMGEVDHEKEEDQEAWQTNLRHRGTRNVLTALDAGSSTNPLQRSMQRRHGTTRAILAVVGSISGVMIGGALRPFLQQQQRRRRRPPPPPPSLSKKTEWSAMDIIVG
ncbi:hypothetical protein CYMTET_17038 [Cymbomonas tetramitiformis]|uniref:Uncharacterized protein n=1 Tax=Cymbomonas tetramitiformis TaxID=36881 RepID=A0AAE0GAQ3_9CHLO|nr:hypothetical protein CYMTET_17038 [Cymbomonas tetramitiformis]